MYFYLFICIIIEAAGSLKVQLWELDNARVLRILLAQRTLKCMLFCLNLWSRFIQRYSLWGDAGDGDIIIKKNK